MGFIRENNVVITRMQVNASPEHKYLLTTSKFCSAYSSFMPSLSSGMATVKRDVVKRDVCPLAR